MIYEKHCDCIFIFGGYREGYFHFILIIFYILIDNYINKDIWVFDL
jgi:hypothetical protein